MSQESIMKHIPLAALLTAIIQLIAGGIWIGSINERVSALETAVAERHEISARLIRVEESSKNTYDLLQRIDSRLGRLEEQR